MSDRDFVGSIPEIYDRYLGPMLFHPYAVDLARRLAARPVRRALELAAGTGIATVEAARALPPTADLVVTDLNQPMLDAAANRVQAPNLTFQTADAQNPPFPDADFDVVFCQFGVMFLPDKPAAYAALRRVVRPGGTLLFSVWDSIDANPITAEVAAAVARRFPADPPDFLSRVPHGYHDPDAIRPALTAAGFTSVTVERVTLPCTAPSPGDVAIGLCQGTPMRHEITTRAPEDLEAITDEVEAAVRARFGPGEVRADMAALVVTAE
jgi:ubiquinone/menaquinone biosynthesis C-methylase UbiE